MTLSIGFMETPDVPRALQSVKIEGWTFNEHDVTYFINRTWVIASGLPGMALWRERLFALMSRNANQCRGLLQPAADARRRDRRFEAARSAWCGSGGP